MPVAIAPDADAAPLDPSTGGFDPLFSVVGHAVAEGATDVHIDISGEHATLRCRIDGIVQTRDKLTAPQARRLLNQIRVAARFPMEAAYAPLEGQFRWSGDSQTRDVRVTLVPTFGRQEAAHLRLLLPLQQWRDLHQLGLRDRDLARLENVLRRPHGLVLVAGPTGSGKTTTLYALAGVENLRRKLCASIEDPVEFELPFVRQMEINERRGLTMAEGLRTLLRTDADVLLIGEIRDEESARIAAQAAMAGRLVLTSIHGRDAASAVQAMNYLCVPYPVLGGALRLVVAQSLIRKVCRECRRSRHVDGSEQRHFQEAGFACPEVVHDAHGCSECDQTGYAGRTGVFEVGVIDEELGRWLAGGPNQQELRARLLERGLQPLAADALQKVADGTTSLAEIMRLLNGDEAPMGLARLPEATAVGGNGVLRSSVPVMVGAP